MGHQKRKLPGQIGCKTNIKANRWHCSQTQNLSNTKHSSEATIVTCWIDMQGVYCLQSITYHVFFICLTQHPDYYHLSCGICSFFLAIWIWKFLSPHWVAVRQDHHPLFLLSLKMFFKVTTVDSLLLSLGLYNKFIFYNEIPIQTAHLGLQSRLQTPKPP